MDSGEPTPAQRQSRDLQRAILLVLITGTPLLCLFGRCPGSNRHVFVFPNDFEGDFEIRERDGLPDVPVENGQRVLTFGRDGTLWLNSNDYASLERWSNNEYRYRDGTPIRFEPANTDGELGPYIGGLANGGVQLPSNGPPTMTYSITGYVGIRRDPTHRREADAAQERSEGRTPG